MIECKLGNGKALILIQYLQGPIMHSGYFNYRNRTKTYRELKTFESN